jgi:hypothetical protein
MERQLHCNVTQLTRSARSGRSLQLNLQIVSLRGHGGWEKTAFYLFFPPQRFDSARPVSDVGYHW